MERSEHILIVDDDAEIRSLLSDYLVRNGYRTSTAKDGREMQRVLEAARIDLVILDIMLPGEDGLTLCRNLRADSEMPVIMLTARGDEMDRILGLEMGADDYLPKPFNPRELLARIKTVLRRSTRLPPRGAAEGARRLHFADWTLDLEQRQLIGADGGVVPLTSGEYRLLQAFLEHPQRTLNRDQLLDLCQGRDWDPVDRSVDVQVSRLRRRLGDDGKNPSLIKTVRGEGYVFTARVSKTT